MSGLSSTLSIAKTAIVSQQYGLNVTGQNIANVNNKDYSVQTAEHINRAPSMYAGFLFGTGVDMSQVRQSVDKLLEERLTSEISSQASLEEQESYINVLENFFDARSENSLTSVMTEFWNSWQDLSNNPKGASERLGIYESGAKLASRFKNTVLSMDDLMEDISSDLHASAGQINALTRRIADLNLEIISVEGKRTANDQRDLRHGLIDELGKLIEVNTIEQSNGSMIINGPHGFPLVNGVDNYLISTQGEDIVWKGSSGSGQIITPIINRGKLGGLLEMRDKIIPKYKADVNELAKEMIWAINYQQSQGAGLEYYKTDMTSQYATDDSKWLTSLEFGKKIDFTKDFTMWVEDKSNADTKYSKIQMDMGISQARITNWKGSSPNGALSTYRFTVVDGGNLGDKEVTQTNGNGIGMVLASTDPKGIAAALDDGIKKQNITVSNAPEGITVIDVADAGGDAKRSAASIANALNKVQGVSAHASSTSATFSLTNTANTHDGDIVSYTLYVDGLLEERSFVRDSFAGSLQEQFEESLLSAVTSINELNEDLDLSVQGMTITSEAGKTLGVQNFSVTDNAGIRLDNFTNFNSGDILTFQIEEIDPGAGTSVFTREVTVNLEGIDTDDQELLAKTFYDSLKAALGENENFSLVHDPASNGVIIRTSNGNSIRMGQAQNDTGNDAVIGISTLAGSTGTGAPADHELRFNNNPADPSNAVIYNANASSGDYITFSDNGISYEIHEANAAAGAKSAVVTGTITMILDKGVQVGSNIAGNGSLFAKHIAPVGSSILTFGGKEGFSGFSSAGGETISFTLDGHDISFDTTSAASTSDIHLAQLFATEIQADLTAAGVEEDYQVILTGNSVSVLKSKDMDDPIVIKNFSDSLGNNAKVRVATGTGRTTNQPENDFLEADLTRTYRNSTTSTLYKDEAIIQWERFDTYGMRTGASGLIHLEDETSNVVIKEKGKETISFDISKGSLVAGNVMTLNTDRSGRPNPLNLKIKDRANSVNELYRFTVESGGKVGHLPDEELGEKPLVIRWENSTRSGTFTIEGHDPPFTPDSPVEVTVDGMTLKFYDGTLLDKDVFTITTDNTGTPKFKTPEGKPTGETMADWHWTIDSFAREFNRHGNGMQALVTPENHLELRASSNYYALTDVEYSGKNGFSEDNLTIKVTDWDSIDFKASSLTFQRTDTGVWGVSNDPTGGKMEILPQGGDDDGFGVDFSGDGVADIRIDFDEKVSGEGFIRFDFTHVGPEDIRYGFGDDAAQDSGLAAALGLNTFFQGKTATSMAMNQAMADSKMIGAARINSQTGVINHGDNSNALKIADVQFQEKGMKTWTYMRNKEEFSKTSISSLDNFFNSIVSSIGIESRRIKHSRSFADKMVKNVTEQRDSISAVSLDEEVIKLIRYQHAFGAASKLLSTSDEMLDTLISSKR